MSMLDASPLSMDVRNCGGHTVDEGKYLLSYKLMATPTQSVPKVTLFQLGSVVRRRHPDLTHLNSEELEIR